MQIGDTRGANTCLAAPAQNETYYEPFMNMYAISRCYFMKALHRSEEPLELVANGTAAASTEATDLTVMEVSTRLLQCNLYKMCVSIGSQCWHLLPGISERDTK